MKNIKLLFTLVLMTITVLGTSCSDWLDDISPRHAIPQSALTDDDLEKLLNGVYATMENYTFTFWWLDDIQGENFKAGPGGGQIIPKIYEIVNNESGGVISTSIQIRRVPFPYSEYLGNKDEVEKAIKLLNGPDTGATRLWWDLADK